VNTRIEPLGVARTPLHVSFGLSLPLVWDKLGAANRIFPGGKSVALIFYRSCFSWGPAPKPPGLTTFEGYNQPEIGNDILDYSLLLNSKIVTSRYLILKID
jgi:hypothetical protein